MAKKVKGKKQQATGDEAGTQEFGIPGPDDGGETPAGDAGPDDGDETPPVIVEREVEVRVTLDLPLMEPPDGAYRRRHIDVQLNTPQTDNLARLQAGLDFEQARLANGRRVQGPADVVRYLLERLEPCAKDEN